MRKPVIIICLVVLGFCVWLLLHRKASTIKAPTAEVQTVTTNSPEAHQTLLTKETNDGSATGQPSEGDMAAAKAKTLTTPQGSNALQQRILSDWQRPIDFYGKVVDENTNAIEGANIAFGWSELPNEEGTRKASTTSDGQGLFSLRDQRGPALDVWVSKPGYVSSHNGQWGFI